MTCSGCGYENDAGGVFCMRCGAQLQLGGGGEGATMTPASFGAQPEPIAPALTYSGFWRRFLAVVVDFIVLSVISTIVFIPIAIVVGLAGFAGASTSGDFSGMMALIEGPLSALNWVLSIVLNWLYEALLTASSKQATLGKMAVGVIVTDLDSRRVSFGRATVRHFAQYLSFFLLLIGYLIQPFTARKQALHDLLAGTLVVMKEELR